MHDRVCTLNSTSVQIVLKGRLVVVVYDRKTTLVPLYYTISIVLAGPWVVK